MWCKYLFSPDSDWIPISIRRHSVAFLILTVLVISGCYPGIKGKAVDSVTGQPLEEALVVAKWTKKHGLLGLQYHDLYKYIETLTDKEGVFCLSGVYDPFVEPPIMVIYKEGYAPWRNDSIFPSSNIVKQNEWQNNATYKLNLVNSKYSIEQLSDFLSYGMTHGIGEVQMFHQLITKLQSAAYEEIRKKSNPNKP